MNEQPQPISHHILPTSSSMVGICMASISILRLLELTSKVALFVDVPVAVDSLIFLVASVISYLSIRSKKNTDKLEQIADVIFLIGLTVMVVNGFLLAYEVGLWEVKQHV